MKAFQNVEYIELGKTCTCISKNSRNWERYVGKAVLAMVDIHTQLGIIMKIYVSCNVIEQNINATKALPITIGYSKIKCKNLILSESFTPKPQVELLSEEILRKDSRIFHSSECSHTFHCITYLCSFDLDQL